MKRKTVLLLVGVLGAMLMAFTDWLMIYGNPTSLSRNVWWLTVGAGQISATRNVLSMMLAFPAMLCYGAALLTMASYIHDEQKNRRYRTLLTFSLMPWLCLHLFVVIVLFAFGWLNQNGYAEAAVPLADAMVQHFRWMTYVGEVIMLPPFLYWAWLVACGQTDLPKPMAAVNVLVFYILLSAVRGFLPDSAFKIAFINGLMSESMVFMFAALAWWSGRQTTLTTSR